MTPMKLVVEAGRHHRQACPIWADVPGIPAGAKTVVLRDLRGREVPAQVVRTDERDPHSSLSRLVWMIDDLQALHKREYQLLLSEAPEPPGASVSDDGSGAVSISILGKPFTTYRYSGNPARPCFFPLLGPGGERVTRSWPIERGIPGEPTDHVHHRSLWMAHGDVNGVDNWTEEPGHGYQQHQRFLELSGGPVCAVLEALNHWTDSTGRKVCEEARRVTVYAVTAPLRVLDVTVTMLASEGELRFGDTKEGGMIALRVAASMNGDAAGLITNAYGALTEEECWGRRSPWCDYSGPVDGHTVGIALMDHPGSFRHPTYWHVRD